MATQEVLLQRLSEAEAALHKLITGQKTVRLEYDNGKAVTYTQATAGDLRAYIAELKVQTGSRSSRSRAGKVWF